MNKCNMNHEARPDQLALLFEEAIDIADRQKRAAFLEAACIGNPALRAEVDRLLQAHEAAGGFLRTDDELADAGSGHELKSFTGFHLGDHLGPYRLLGLIGEGASSTVYLAEQEQPVRRWVALKVIKPGMDTEHVISRFELERQALALMDHPGIAKVLDAGAAPNGRPYFVMELVRGMPITQHCDEQRLDLPQRLELFVQVCQAVLHAHQKGIVHRDIKPDNILVCLHDNRAFPKIIDFGIAKVLNDAGLSNTPGTGTMPFLGTPTYMSPEQAQMTMPDLDTRTDIYSLGALLYELLTGHPPFDHHTLMAAGLEEMCRIIRVQDPPSPSVRFSLLPNPERATVAQARATSPEELRRAISGDLDWICLKALEKEREQRYETAANLAEDVNRHTQHLPVSAAAPTLQYRFSKLIKRNRKAVVTACAFCLILIGSAVVTTSMAIHARSNARQAHTLRTAAIQAQKASHAAMVGMHVTSGLSEAEYGNHDRAVLWFANAAHAAGPGRAEFNTNLRRALSWLNHVPLPVAAAQLSTAFSLLEFSPASDYLLAVDRKGAWLVLDCLEEQPLAWVNSAGPVTAAAWHPDGSLLALAQGRAVQIRNTADGTLLRQIATSENITAVGFTPDGKRIVFGGRSISAMDLRTGLRVDNVWNHPEPATGFAFAPQSSLMVTVSVDSDAHVLRSDDGELLRVDASTLPHRGSIRTDACANKTNYRDDYLEAPTLSLPSFSRGNVLLTRTGPFEISAWDLHTEVALHTFQGLCCSCRFVVSPDGALMACGLQGSKVGVWDIVTAQPLTLLTSRGACILDIAFGSSAEILLTAETGRTARIWSASEEKEMFSAMHHTDEVDKVACAPNGTLVATAQVDGLVRLWLLPRINVEGHTIASDYGPRIVRLDSPGDHFIATKEPAWEAHIHDATVYAAATGMPVGQPMRFQGDLQDAALASDCNRVALALSGAEGQPPGMLRFVELTPRRVMGELPLQSVPSSLAWHPDGHQVAVICRSGELLIGHPGGNDPVVWAKPVLETSTRLNPCVSFTPDGTSLISLAPTGQVEVRDATIGVLRYAPLQSDSTGFWSFAISGDSRRIATTTPGGEVRVWDLESGAPAGGALHHPGWVYRCRFSPDGTQLLTASRDAKCRIWDLRSGQPSGPALMHPSEVYDAAFTPDGSSVLTACRDGNLRIWEPASGQLLAPPFRVGAQAFNVEITADGRHAVAGSLGTAIHILALAPLKPDAHWSAKELCLLGEVVSGSTISQGEIRDLTTAEWLQRLAGLQGSNMGWFRATRASRLPEMDRPVIGRPDGSPTSPDPASEASCLAGDTCGIVDCPGRRPGGGR